MAKIQIYLLQTPYVLLDGSLVAFPFKKAEALFYYLATEKTVTRDYISTLLWEDANAETARKNLRNALYTLKKTFGFEIICSSNGFNLTLSPNLDIHSDLTDFEQGDVSCYKDDFLCNFFIKKTTLFEDWMIHKREYLRNQFLISLFEYIHSLPSSNLGVIERCCFNYLKHDPFDERIISELLCAYKDNQLYLKGIQLYQKFRKDLEEDLGIIPGSEVTQLYRQLRTSWAETTTDEESEERKVIAARFKEVSLLDHAYDLFQNGYTVCALIDGETGVGKSTLVQNLTDAIDRNNILYLESYCYKDETHSALYPWNSIFMQLDEYLETEGIEVSPSYIQVISQFFPTFGNAAPSGNAVPLDLTNIYNMRAIQNSILRIFYKITKQKPVFLMIDNLHFSDSSTLQVLSYLIRELQKNFFIVATCHDCSVAPLDEFIAHFPPNAELTQIHLKPFSQDDMREIIASKTDISKIPDHILTSIYETTAGNAFFLNELLNSYKETNSLETLSLQAQAILSQRLSGLSTSARQLLDIISLLHNYTSLNLLEHIYGGSTLDILECIEELTSHSLIIEKQRQGSIIFSFVHKKMQEYIVNLIPRSKQRILFNRIACALEQILPTGGIGTYNRLIQYFHLAGVYTKVVTYQLYLFEKLSISLFELYPSQAPEQDIPNQQNIPSFLKELELQLQSQKLNFHTSEEYEKLYSQFLLSKGRYYILSGLYNEGLICIHKCLKSDYIKQHSSYLLQAYRQMIYYGIQLYEPSIMKQYLDKGLEISSSQNYLMEYALFLRLNGLYNLMCSNHIKSQEFLLQSIEILEQHSEISDISYLNISAAFNYLGENERKQHHDEQAVSYYQQAINLCKDNGLSENPTHYTNMGSALWCMHQEADALSAYQTACSLYDNSCTLMGRSIAKSRCALLLCKQGDFSQVDCLLQEASQACRKLGSPIEKGLLRKTQAELLVQFPSQCKKYLPEPVQFYINDAKRLLQVDYNLPEWRELNKL